MALWQTDYFKPDLLSLLWLFIEVVFSLVKTIPLHQPPSLLLHGFSFSYLNTNTMLQHSTQH